jgi:hypothetical protein
MEQETHEDEFLLLSCYVLCSLLCNFVLKKRQQHKASLPQRSLNRKQVGSLLFDRSNAVKDF